MIIKKSDSIRRKLLNAECVFINDDEAVTAFEAETIALTIAMRWARLNLCAHFFLATNFDSFVLVFSFCAKSGTVRV